MKMITFRFDPALIAALDAAAEQAGISRTQFVTDILTNAVGHGEPPIILGWIAFDRPGEFAAEWDCPECGQDMYDPHIGIMSNNIIVGPVCGGCAVAGE